MTLWGDEMADNVVTALLRIDGVPTTTRPLYQYDYGQILQLTGHELPPAYEVHFANAGDSTSKTQIGGADGVSIPDEYLESGAAIHVWLFLHAGPNDGETKAMIIIPVKTKAKTGDEEPVPVEQSVITQAIAALNDGVQRAEAAAKRIEQTVTDALEQAKESGEFNGPQGPAWQDDTDRVTSLDATGLGRNHTIEALGIPAYVIDVSEYSAYGLTDTGWYVFARITAPDGTAVMASTSVTGAAGYIATVGADHVDVAVRFGVTAESQAVTIDWGAYQDSFVFRAPDLAVRNLDYRTTFYVYDAAPYATWEHAITTDETFQDGANYYTLDGDVYTLAEVTAGDPIPPDTYYKHSKLILSGMVRNVTYKFNEQVDAAIEIVLPEIADDGHGAWFEFQFDHKGSTSITLTPAGEGVKSCTAGASAGITAGLNVVDLHYTFVNGVKLWTLANVHSNIPA